MRCPACGVENVPGAPTCTACGRALDEAAAKVRVRVSRLALTSSICVLVAGVLFVPSLIAHLDPRVLYPRAPILNLTELLIMLLTGLAFLLGLLALLGIATSGGRVTGYPFAMLGAAGPFFFLLGALYVPTLGGFKATLPRILCGTNLSFIGKAMLIYANDCADDLPVAGGVDTTWGPGLRDWAAADRSEAFGLDPNGAGGRATVSSSFWLLVKYADAPTKWFVCRGDRGTRRFDPNEHLTSQRSLTALWDFGPDPAKHCSYSYHMPYGLRHLTTSSEPGTPVAADRNAWTDGPRWKANDFSKFRWDGSEQQQRVGNAVAHWLDGQNVLFLDSHVSFEKRSFCGRDRDNIYTSWNGDDKSGGVPPRVGSVPADRKDALLVNDPPAARR
jgi:hypothetical protein